MGPARRLKARWAGLTGTGAAASVSLGLLVFFCVFVAVAGPRDSLGVRTHAFRQALSATPVTAKSVAATLDFTTFASALGGQFAVSNLTAARDELAANLAKARVPLARGASWSGVTSAYARVSGAGPGATKGCAPPEMEVLYRDRLSRYARLVSGRLPGAPASGQPAILPVAVTPATAARFGLRPGSRLGMAGVTLLVTGIVRPVSPGSPFWTLDPDAAAPTQNSCGHTVAATYWLGAAFVGQAGMPTFLSRLNTFRMQLTWDYPLNVSHLTADQAPALENELTNGLTQAGQLVTSTNGQPTLMGMSAGLVGVVAVFIQEDRAVGGVLGLLYVSLTVIGAVAVLLAALLVAEHRSEEFAVMRARGASLRQLARVALRAGAVVTLPAAVAGAALAVSLTPGAGEPLEWWLGGAVVLVALAGLPLIVVYTHRPAARASRQQPRRGVARRRAARRLVAEVTAIALAVGGLLVLREQGPHTAGSDIYARAAPVLVAIPAAIVVMRCYPVVVRWLMLLAGARPGVTAYVGLARSSRGPRTAMLPIFALILGLAVVAFGAMVHAAVVRGEVAASWQQTGADAVVDASGSYLPFGAAVQQAITAVPGIERTATVLVTTGSPSNSGALAVAAVNPARYAALIADTPAPRFPAAALARRHTGPGNQGTVPALATRAAAYQLGRGSTALQIGTLKLAIRVVGTVNGVPGVAGPAVVVLPDWAFGAKPPPPTLMLVIGPHLDGPKLVSVAQRALPAATVTLRSQALAELTGAPLPHGGSVALTVGAAAAAGLSLVILLITLVLSARSRELTLARMAAMGLSQAQARWLVVAEALPLIVAAIVGGVASAWALASLIGPSISLSAFTGTSAAVPVQAEPAPLAAAAAGLMAVAFAALAIQTVIADRRGVARTLRMD
jgi:putative ABC transport system permease protein